MSLHAVLGVIVLFLYGHFISTMPKGSLSDGSITLASGEHPKNGKDELTVNPDGKDFTGFPLHVFHIAHILLQSFSFMVQACDEFRHKVDSPRDLRNVLVT